MSNKNTPDPKKFSIIEMFNDSCGRTSLSKVMACVVIIVSCFGFIWGTLYLEANVIGGAVAFLGSGTVLLGVRRFTEDKELKYIDDNNDNQYNSETNLNKELLHD